MHIVMLSRDLSAVDMYSAAGKRIGNYRKAVGDLSLAVFDVRKGIVVALRDVYVQGKRALSSTKEHTVITAQDPFELGLIGYLLKKRYRVPLELQVHTDFLSPYFMKESLKNKIRVILAKFLLKRADCIRVVSERVATSIQRILHIDEACIHVLPIWVNIKTYQIVARTDKKDVPIFLIVSRLTREKNIGLAIHAFKEVHKKFPNSKLIIVGDGPERRNLETQVSRYMLQDFIFFVGWQDNVPIYYAKALCYLLTSNYEGYSRAVVEAMVAGVPVIMTDVGIAGELVKDGESGLVVPVGSYEGLYKAMERIIEDKILCKNLSEQGKRVVKKFYSEDQYIKNIVRLWQTCAEKR